MARFTVSLPTRIASSDLKQEGVQQKPCDCYCSYRGSQFVTCAPCAEAELLRQRAQKVVDEDIAWKEYWDEFYHTDADHLLCTRYSGYGCDCIHCYDQLPAYWLDINELEELAPETFVSMSAYAPRDPIVYPTWYYLPAKPAGRGSRSRVKHWRRSNGDIHSRYNHLCKLDAAMKTAKRDFREQVNDLI